MSSSAETMATGFPLVIPTKSMLPTARLVLRNDLGQVIQQWLIRQSKCTLGSASSCTLRCDAPGIAPYHALIVVGARQIFLRALAPRLTRDGVPASELLLTDDENQFELAGHNFCLFRRSSEQAAGSSVSQQAPPEAGPGRLKFTLARPLEISRQRKMKSQPETPVVRTEDLPTIDSKWVARMVQEAIEPLECQLQNMLMPLTELQTESRKQSLLRKQLLAESNARTTASSQPPPDPALIRLPDQLEELAASQSAAVSMLTDRIASVNHQLAVIEQLVHQDAVADEISQHDTFQNDAIEQLQTGMISVSSAIQDLETRQQAARAEDRGWKDEVQAEMSALRAALESLAQRNEELVASSGVNAQLENWREDVQAQFQQLQDLILQVAERAQTVKDSPQDNAEDQAWRLDVQEQFASIRVALDRVSEQTRPGMPAIQHAPPAAEDQAWRLDVQEQFASIRVALDTVSEQTRPGTPAIQHAPPAAEDQAWRLEVQEQFASIRAALNTVSEQTRPGMPAIQHAPPAAEVEVRIPDTQADAWPDTAADTSSMEPQHDVGEDERFKLDERPDSQQVPLPEVEPENEAKSSEELTEQTLNEQHVADAIQAVQQSETDVTVSGELSAGEDGFLEFSTPQFESVEPEYLHPEWEPEDALETADEESAGMDETPPQDEVSSDSRFVNVDFNITDAEARLPDELVESVQDQEADGEWIQPTMEETPTWHDQGQDASPDNLIAESEAEAASPFDSEAVWEEQEDVRFQFTGEETDASEESTVWQDATDSSEQGDDGQSEFFGMGADYEHDHAIPVDDDEGSGEQPPSAEPYHPTVQLADNTHESEGGNALPSWWTEEDALGSFHDTSDYDYAPSQGQLSHGALDSEDRLEPGEYQPQPETPSGMSTDDNMFAGFESHEEEIVDRGHSDESGSLHEIAATDSPAEHDPEPVADADPLALPITPTQGHDEGEDGSVEDYMRKLLARMRGVPEDEVEMPTPALPTPPLPNKPMPTVATGQVENKGNGNAGHEDAGRPTSAPSVAAADASVLPDTLKTATDIVTAPFDPDTYVPRVVAPEKIRNLAAMRELANSSARTAIHSSTRKRHVASILLKASISGVGMLVAVVLISINGLQVNIGLVATVAALLVGAIWGYDALSSVRPLIQSSLILKPREVVSAESQDEGTEE